VRIELVEYLDNETGHKHWDVKIGRRGSFALRTSSITDDYGFKDRDSAVAAYTRLLAIERGELKVGLSFYTIAEAEIP